MACKLETGCVMSCANVRAGQIGRSAAVRLAAMALALLIGAKARAGVTFDTVALSGTDGVAMGAGPGFADATAFVGFTSPVLNDNGEIAFGAGLSGASVDGTNNEGIWSTVGGSPLIAARKGVDGIEGPNLGSSVTFSAFGDPVINASGQVGFEGIITGTGIDSTNNHGIWISLSSTPTIAARQGADGPGPNLGAGVTFSNISGYVGIPVLNDSGAIAFAAVVTGTNVDSTNDRGVWTTIGGAPTVAARTGSAGPGPNLGAGVVFNGLASPLLNSADELVFYATLSGTGVDSTNDAGIWTAAGSTITPVARTGDDALGPGLGAGVHFANFDGYQSSSGQPVINASGAITFRAGLTGTGVDNTNNAGIWTYDAGSLTTAARSGSGGPGPDLGAGVVFSDFDNPVINSAGGIAFRGFVTGTGITTNNHEGLWTEAGGVLTPIAQTGTDGDLGPGLGAGVHFTGFNGRPLLNASGQVVFAATIFGNGVTTANNSGIWASVGGVLEKIVRTGDLFDVDPGDGQILRTIASIDLYAGSGSSAQDGRRVAFNDNGLLTFHLTFTDGSQGVFTAQLTTSTVPAPAALPGGAAMLSLMMIRRRRKRRR